MAHGLLGIFGHQAFEFALGALVVGVSISRVAKQRCKFGPGVGSVHVDHVDGFEGRSFDSPS